MYVRLEQSHHLNIINVITEWSFHSISLAHSSSLLKEFKLVLNCVTAINRCARYKNHLVLCLRTSWWSSPYSPMNRWVVVSSRPSSKLPRETETKKKKILILKVDVKLHNKAIDDWAQDKNHLVSCLRTPWWSSSYSPANPRVVISSCVASKLARDTEGKVVIFEMEMIQHVNTTHCRISHKNAQM